MKAINFSAEMVRAILDGNKTQTRRVIKDQLRHDAIKDTYKYRDSYWYPLDEIKSLMVKNNKCHYGKVGDLLYVREPWDFIPVVDTLCHVHYWADNELRDATNPVGHGIKTYNEDRVRPPQHMPKWATRILLKITSIRVERLQEISEADARAEGFHATGWMPSYSDPDSGGDGDSVSAAGNFLEYWHGLYPSGYKSCESNPWVWVIDFEVVQRG